MHSSEGGKGEIIKGELFVKGLYILWKKMKQIRRMDYMNKVAILNRGVWEGLTVNWPLRRRYQEVSHACVKTKHYRQKEGM